MAKLIGKDEIEQISNFAGQSISGMGLHHNQCCELHSVNLKKIQLKKK